MQMNLLMREQNLQTAGSRAPMIVAHDDGQRSLYREREGLSFASGAYCRAAIAAVILTAQPRNYHRGTDEVITGIRLTFSSLRTRA